MKYILIQRLVESLEGVFIHHYKADRALEMVFKKYRSMGSRDRKWIAENFYHIVRYYLRYAFCAQSENLWDITGTALLLRYEEKPPFTDFKNLDEQKIKKRILFLKKDPWLYHAFPEFWKILEQKEKLNIRFPHWMEELNREAHAFIRVNTLKISTEELQRIFASYGIHTEKVRKYENLLRLPDKRNLFGSREFRNGYFEFQDPGSAEVGLFCKVKPGMKIVDVCAGAGGKALHLATLMNNKGSIICTDIHEVKLQELKKRRKRSGTTIIRTEKALSSAPLLRTFLKKYDSYADVLLLDVPCSGSGVIKRNPDTKWRITPAFMEFTRKTQQDILNTYANIVKPEGYIVYATCSLFASENEEQINHFLKSNPSFTKEEEKYLLPGPDNDGFYMCKLKRIS